MDVIAATIKEIVCGYSRSKDEAIYIFKKFIVFIYDKYKIKLQVDFPKIPISNSFERIMYISKYLQNPDNKVSDLEDEL